MEWYYVRDNQRQGPISEAEFETLAASGTIRAETLVWHAGLAEWQPYRQVNPAAVPAGGVPDDTEECAVSGKRYPRREMIQYEGRWIAAEHRDRFFQQLREGVPPTGFGDVPGPYGYGGFWRRFVARLVDGIVLWVVQMILAMPIGYFLGQSVAKDPQHPNIARILLFEGVFICVSFAIQFSYEIFFVRKFDATPGKMAMGLKILRTDGQKLSVLRIVGRQFGQMLSGMILLIGYIMAGVDEEKRALHDRICDTRVVRTRA